MFFHLQGGQAHGAPLNTSLALGMTSFEFRDETDICKD